MRNIAPQGRSEANEMRFHHFFVDFGVVFEMIIEKKDFLPDTQWGKFFPNQNRREKFSPSKICGEISPHIRGKNTGLTKPRNTCRFIQSEIHQKSTC